MVPNNIIHPKLMDIYENTPQDVLRWQVIANTAIREVPKAVMRERLRRRVREAFREALKEMGYDRNGRVLRPAPAAGKTAKDLRGTLEIHCRSRAGLDCEFGEIVQFARSALDAVVKSFNQSSAKSGHFSMGGEWWKLGVAEYRPPLRDQQPPGR
jgi:RNase P protein component